MKNSSNANTEPGDGDFSTLLYTVLHSTVYAGYFSQNIG
jgi:hypothetical protein